MADNHITLDFKKRAEEVRTFVKENKGTLGKDEAIALEKRRKILQDVPAAVQQLDAMRTGAANKRPKDVSFAEFAQRTWGFAPDAETGVAESFFKAMGLDYGSTTLQYIQNLADTPDGYRWLTAEIIREAMRLGLRKPAFWPNIVSAVENIGQPKITMPFINMSDATPTKIGETETIPTGALSFGQRDIKLQKVGVGLKISDEVQQYTSLNLLAIFLQDMGVKMNLAQDIMAIDVLINGDGNSNAAPVIGVANTTNGITYADLLGAWISLGLLGRMPDSMLSNKNVALSVLTLPEFTNSLTLLAGLQPKIVKPRTPLPSVQNYDVHGAMPVNNQLMLIDSTAALIKFNSQALKLESQRIAERQIDGTYATLTTGFANLFRDGRLIIDGSLAASSYPFPSWMDAGAVQAASAFKVL